MAKVESIFERKRPNRFKECATCDKASKYLDTITNEELLQIQEWFSIFQSTPEVQIVCTDPDLLAIKDKEMIMSALLIDSEKNSAELDPFGNVPCPGKSTEVF